MNSLKDELAQFRNQDVEEEIGPEEGLEPSEGLQGTAVPETVTNVLSRSSSQQEDENEPPDLPLETDRQTNTPLSPNFSLRQEEKLNPQKPSDAPNLERYTPLSSLSSRRYTDNSSTTLKSLGPDDEPRSEARAIADHSIFARHEFEALGVENMEETPGMGGFSAEDLWPSLEISELDKDGPMLNSSNSSQSWDTESSVETASTKREIFVLGVGVIGKFIAHGLAGLPNPPQITLLMQRPLLMQQWHDEGGALTILKRGRLHTRTGFNIESAVNFHRMSPYQRFPGFGPNLEHTAEPPLTMIDSLIVTTASKVTIPALMAVRHRLRPSSTICLIQDGMGVIEDLNTIVFPDPSRRPTYVLGHLSNASKLRPSERTFMIEQKGDVQITCSKQPQRHVAPATESGPMVSRKDYSWTLPAAFLVGSLARVPEFHTHTVGHRSFVRSQLHRVIAHAVIGPVSVLHDCSNQELLSSYNARMTMRHVLGEMSQVVLALPELYKQPNVERDFCVEKLEAIVRGLLIKHADSTSTMLQNVRVGKRTDIDYFNGYLLLRAAELGIDCPRNEMLINIVKGKQMIKSKTVDAYVPFTGE